MSLLDKMIGSAMAPASESERRSARSRVLAASIPGDWLSLAVRHHQQIEAAFQAVVASSEISDRRAALQELARLLTGHAIAEEAVLYPALARCGEKRHAERAYSEQAQLKMQLANLHGLALPSVQFMDQIDAAYEQVLQHHYEEEAFWFIELLQSTPVEPQRELTQRFQQEFDRYVCSDELVGVLESVAVPLGSPTTVHTR
jgi:Hemerythrin HHE cation binding domain